MTRRDRSQAIQLLAIAACEPYFTPLFRIARDLGGCSRAGYRLALLAWAWAARAYQAGEGNVTYAEAEAMLQTGWEP